jgi:hypothetical protein
VKSKIEIRIRKGSKNDDEVMTDKKRYFSVKKYEKEKKSKIVEKRKTVKKRKEDEGSGNDNEIKLDDKDFHYVVFIYIIT